MATIVFLAILDQATAYTTFDSQCSLPDTSTNYISSPNTRGTLDIVWLCYGVTIACIYSVQHANVPWKAEHYDPDDRKWRPWLKFWSPVLWCAFTLLVPEYLYGVYLLEFIQVTIELRKLHKSLPQTKSRASLWRSIAGKIIPLHNEPEVYAWTITHMWYANMSGFAVSLKERPVEKPTREEHSNGDASDKPDDSMGAQTKDAVTATVEMEQEKGPVRRKDVEDDLLKESIDLSQADLYLTARTLRESLELGLIESRPIDEEDIRSMAKGDWFAKLLVALQLLQFSSSLIARLVEKLPITALEVSTAAFAVCSLVVYGCLLYKPKNVPTSVQLKVDKSSYFQILKLLHREFRLKSHITALSEDDLRQVARPAMSGVPRLATEDDDYPFLAVTAIVGVVFASICVAGWNVDFKFLADRWLWRSASIATISLPLIFTVWVVVLDITMIAQTVLLLYMVARLILLVEMVRNLFYLPPEAFLSTSWSASIPHFS